MATDYKIRLKSAAGLLVAEVTDYLDLAYTKRVNSMGSCLFRLPGEHTAIALLEHRSEVEIWRRNTDLGIGWYNDCNGLYLDQKHTYTEKPIFTAGCPGPLWLLSTRWALWPANTANRTAFAAVAAETIMKTLADYNAGPNATTGNGRERTGTITGLTIQADGANGNTVTWYCAWKNLLTELQRLARVAGGDFDLIKTGPAAYDFRWYTGQRGTDRTSTVTFALQYGNMGNAVYRYNRTDEATAALAAGGGRETARAIQIRTGPDYSAGNDVEIFVDARNAGITAAALQAVADQRLDEAQAREAFTFDVIQTPGSAYGVHYCVAGALGDLVTAKYMDIVSTQKIVSVTVTDDRMSGEIIDVETEEQ